MGLRPKMKINTVARTKLGVYTSSWKTFAKQKIFICIILWLHLHAHAGANIYITYTHICICIHMKDICITKSLFAPSYGCIHVCISDKDFCIRHSVNKHLHLHSHLHPHEGHLHNKIFICTIIWLHSCLHIQ